MTSEQCRQCLSRIWTIYREGKILMIRCGHCDLLNFDAKILNAETGAEL